jgi:hypothetical protein
MMARNYEDTTFEEYDELRTVLHTPDNPMIDTTTQDNNNHLPFNDYPELFSSIPSSPVNDNCVQFSDEIPFDHNEWQVIDPSSGKKRRPRQHEFLELLLEDARYGSYVRWLDQDRGLFEILLPNQVATLWGKVKNRHTDGKMTYATFARGLRYHYTTGIMIKTKKKFTFCFNKSSKKNSS